MQIGILDMIGLAATLIFAIPVANFGVNRLMAGETAMGIALLVVAVAMVVLPQYFMNPKTIVRKLVRGVLPGRFRGDDAEPTTADEHTDQ